MYVCAFVRVYLFACLSMCVCVCGFGYCVRVCTCVCVALLICVPLSIVLSGHPSSVVLSFETVCVKLLLPTCQGVGVWLMLWC